MAGISRVIVLVVLMMGLGSAQAGAATNDPHEIARIQSRLSLIEDLLRQRARPDLTDQQLRNRVTVLNHLHAYWQRGEFPRRVAGPVGIRRPVFIDVDGAHCAVGYLLKVTGYGELVRDVAATNNFVYADTIQDQRYLDWVDEFGMEHDELALIQPHYGHRFTPEVREKAKEKRKEMQVMRFETKLTRLHEERAKLPPNEIKTELKRLRRQNKGGWSTKDAQRNIHWQSKYWWLLAHAEARLGNLQSASLASRHAIDIRKGWPMGLYQLAAIYAQAGRDDDMLATLDRLATEIEGDSEKQQRFSRWVETKPEFKAMRQDARLLDWLKAQQSG